MFPHKDGHWWQQRSFMTEDGLEQKCVKIDTKIARQWFMRGRSLKPRPTVGQNTATITPQTENGDTNHNSVTVSRNTETKLETKPAQDDSSDSGTCSNSSSSCLWSCTSSNSSSSSVSSASNSTDVSPQSQHEEEFEKRKRRSGYYHQHNDDSLFSLASLSASPSPASQSSSQRVYSVETDANVAAILQIGADGNVGVIVAEINDKVNKKNVKSEGNVGSYSEPNTILKEHNGTSSECSTNLHEDTSRNALQTMNIEEKGTTTCQEASLDVSAFTGCNISGAKSSTSSTNSSPAEVKNEVKISTRCVTTSSNDIALRVQVPNNLLSEITIPPEHQPHLNAISTCHNASSPVITKGDQVELADIFHPETDIFAMNSGFNRREIITPQAKMFDKGMEQKVSEVKTEAGREEHDCPQESPSVEFRFCPEVFALFSPAVEFNGPSDYTLKNIEVQDSPDQSENRFMPDVSGVFCSDKITEILPHTENTTSPVSNMKSDEQLDNFAIETPVRKLNMSTTSSSTGSGWSPEYESGLSCPDDIEVVVIDLNDTPDSKKDVTSTKNTNKELKENLLAGDTEFVTKGQTDGDVENCDGRKPGEVVIDLNDTFDSKKDATTTYDTNKELKGTLLVGDTEFVKNGQTDTDVEPNDGGKPGEACVKCEGPGNIQELSDFSEHESKKGEAKAICKNVQESSNYFNPESEKDEKEAICEEVRSPKGCTEVRNIASTLAGNDLSAKKLEPPGEIIGPETQTEEGTKDINEYLRLQILSNTKNGSAEARVDHDVKTSRLESETLTKPISVLQEPYSNHSKIVCKSSVEDPKHFKVPCVQGVLPVFAEKLKTTTTREKSKGAQLEPTKPTHLPQRKVSVISLPTKKLSVDEKTKDSLPGLTLQPKSLNPNIVKNTLQHKEKHTNSAINAPKYVPTRANKLTCIVKPISCQLKTNAEGVRQRDFLQSQTCSQKKEENIPVIRILKRESKQQVETKIENTKKAVTVQSNRKQVKKHEGERQQQAEQFKGEQEIMGSRCNKKESNYLNHHAKLVRNFEDRGKKLEKKKNDADESPIPIQNSAKLMQSTSKIPEPTNTEQNSKANSQIQNGSKLIHPLTKLQTTSSEVNTQLHKHDKVTKVKPERGTQPSEHAKRDVKKNAKDTNKSGLNIETNSSETTVTATKTGEFVGKAGMPKTKSRLIRLQSNATTGPCSVSVSKSCDIPPTTKTHQLRNNKSKPQTNTSALVEKQNKIQNSSKQEPKLAVDIKNCTTKAPMPPVKTPANSTNKVRSTEKSPTMDNKSSSNKINSPKNSLGAPDNEKNETKSPSMLQKILTRVWNFSTKFCKTSTEAEEQKRSGTEIQIPEKAERKLTNSNQKHASKCSKEQDHLKLNRKFSTIEQDLQVSDQNLININKTSPLDVVKSSTETELAPVSKCKQPEKENSGQELQQDDRELTVKQHASGIDPIISNNGETSCPIEECRNEISCAKSSETELEIYTQAQKPPGKTLPNATNEEKSTEKLQKSTSVFKSSSNKINSISASQAATKIVHFNENEYMNSLTKLLAEKERERNQPGERMSYNLLAQKVDDGSSSEPESSYTESFETPDSSFEDIEHRSPSDINRTGTAQAKYTSELIYEMTDDMSLFTNEKETYKMMFRKDETQVNKGTQNELCPGLFNLRFGKTTAQISNVILSKSPGELKSIDAMHKSYLKFPTTKLHCTSRKSERLAFLETEEGNYDVAMCATYPSDREMKNKLNKLSGFVSQAYQMSFSRGEARTFPVIRFSDISATPKYMFSEMGKKKIRRIKYVKVKPERLQAKAHPPDKLEDQGRMKSEEHAVEVGNKMIVSNVCEDKSAKSKESSVETLSSEEIKKAIGNNQASEPTKNLSKCNKDTELKTSSSVPCGPQKVAVRPFVTKQRQESKHFVNLDQTDGRKKGTNKQQENAISKLCEQGTRPKNQRATEPSQPGKKPSPENHEKGDKISSAAVKSVVQIQKGHSGAAYRTSHAATAKTTSQRGSKVLFISIATDLNQTNDKLISKPKFRTFTNF